MSQRGEGNGPKYSFGKTEKRNSWRRLVLEFGCFRRIEIRFLVLRMQWEIKFIEIGPIRFEFIEIGPIRLHQFPKNNKKIM
jgi:hypothetical protein